MPALYIFIRDQGQMLLFANKIGIHWYFQFAVKMADNRDTALLPITATQKLNVNISLAAIIKHAVISANLAILRFYHFIMIQFEIDVL